ncbi:MAG: transporter substrate-binding domain-containing protein [Bauldia sp.]
MGDSVAGDNGSSAPWRIGVLFSQSGVTAGIERTQLNATLLAIGEINASGGILGRPIEPIPRDPASNPKQFRAFAEQLMAEEQVNIILGCYMSSTRKAVLPVVEGRKGLLFYPTLYEGFEYSAHCVYTGAAPNQNSVQLARYLIERYGNRFLLVGSNYIYPYESNRIMTDLVVQAGGKVVDELYVPLDAKPQDFDRAIRQMKKTAPDVVFSTVVGGGTAMFYEAYRKAGFDPAKMPISSLTTSEAEIAEMSAEAAEGAITAAPYFETLPGAANRAFVSAFKLRFGPDAPVTAEAEAAYFQVHLMALAIARAGTTIASALMPELYRIDFDAPQGNVQIDAENNHTWLTPRVGRVNAEKRFEIVWDANVRVKPDPYFLAPRLDDWTAPDPRAANA